MWNCEASQVWAHFVAYNFGNATVKMTCGVYTSLFVRSIPDSRSFFSHTAKHAPGP